MFKKVFKNVNALMISFICAGLFIGLLVSAQFQSSVVANSFLIDEINAQKELLSSFDQDRKLLKARIANLRMQIEEGRKTLEQTSQNSNFQVLEGLKAQIGLNQLRGAGVKINLQEGEAVGADQEANLLHAADLRDLVNLLRAAGAEGISINGQRIIASTTINSLGNSIMINRVKVNAPYDVQAIVSLETLSRNLNERELYPDLFDRIKAQKVNFKVDKLNLVTLPIYDGDYLINYAKAKLQ
ncbi:MAG: DUF881 domain-containing protein [Candidatus Altimarinota bacterium]